MALPGSPITSARFGQLASILPDAPSTQDIVRGAGGAVAPEGFLALVDHQTSGRGRRGRTWSDVPGQALMFSLLLRPTVPVAAMAPVALVAGIAVAEAIGGRARLRWPNDVVIGGAKVAGILAELETPLDRDPYVILGVGVNVNAPADLLPETDRLPATSLRVETGVVTDRLTLLQAILDRFQPAYHAFVARGFEPLGDRYAALDDLAGREVELDLGAERVAGIGRGADGLGRLVLALDGGGERAYDAGEVIRVH